MQKIKEEKGITLAILIVTIIVMLILVGVTMDMGFDAADSAKISQQKSELQMVGQATISEYTKALKLNYIPREETEEIVEDIPANFVGKEITNTGDNLLPNLPSGDWALNQFDAVGYKSYFRLTPEDLDKLNISNTTDTYIVNYYTGEVFNETKQMADDDTTVLYLRLNTSAATSKETDTSSFVDVEE